MIQATAPCSAAPQGHRGVEAARGALPEAQGEGGDRDRSTEDRDGAHQGAGEARSELGQGRCRCREEDRGARRHCRQELRRSDQKLL